MVHQPPWDRLPRTSPLNGRKDAEGLEKGDESLGNRGVQLEKSMLVAPNDDLDAGGDT